MTTDEMEAFIDQHGIVAFLDHLGLDGTGNTVNDLYRIAFAARACWRYVIPDGNDRFQMQAHDQLRDALAKVNLRDPVNTA